MSNRESLEHRLLRLLHLNSTYGMHAATYNLTEKGESKMTNCYRCKYSYKNHCENRKDTYCHDCEMFDDNLSVCKCATVAIDADCPYFVDYGGDEE